MTMEEDLVRLVKEIVKQEMDSQRVRTSEFVGRGGDTVISSRGNIYLTSGENKSIFANGVKIVTGSGAATDLSNYMRKDSAGGTQTQNNIILMENTLKMNSATQIWFNASNDNLAGKIYGTSVLSEGTTYYGVLITPTTGVTSGNFYIGEYTAAPAGDGIKITDQGILIYPATGYDVSLGFAELANFRLDNLATGSLPDGGKGGLAYDTTTSSVKVNKGTVGAPDWVEIGGTGTGGWTDGANVVYVTTSTDLVGIGTSSPQSALDLGTGSAGRSLVWGGATGTNWYASIGTSYGSADLNALSGLKLGTGADTVLYSYTGTYAPSGIRLDYSTGDILFFNEASGAKTAGNTFDYAANTKLAIGTSAITSYLDVIPSAADTKDLGTSTYWWRNIYTQKVYFDDANTYISNSAGSMQLHVAAGETVDIVVG